MGRESEGTPLQKAERDAESSARQLVQQGRPGVALAADLVAEAARYDNGEQLDPNQSARLSGALYWFAIRNVFAVVEAASARHIAELSFNRLLETFTPESREGIAGVYQGFTEECALLARTSQEPLLRVSAWVLTGDRTGNPGLTGAIEIGVSLALCGARVRGHLRGCLS